MSGSERAAGTADVDWVDWNPPVPVLAGELRMQMAVVSRSADGRCVTGLWRCSPSTSRVTMPCHESLVVVDGSMSFTPENGETRRLGRGDTTVLPVGSTNIIEVHEPTTTFWTFWADDEPVDLDLP